MTPYFSILIPTYNRQKHVLRAIDSCLKQEFDSFELIVVDDASTDGTVDSVSALADRRIKLLQQAVNRGVSASRHLGVQESSGQWIVCLDSDDELYPSALQTMFARVRTLPENIRRVCFSHRLDDGTVTPWPVIEGSPIGYRDLLRWIEHVARSDMCNCIRRSTFVSVPFPVSRVFELGYHLDFAVRFESLMSSEIVGVMHWDAPNRASNISFHDAIRLQRTMAADMAAEYDRIVCVHGPALNEATPGLFRRVLRMRAQLAFLARGRRGAIGPSVDLLRAFPMSVANVATVLFGCISPGVLAYTYRLRSSRGRG